MNRLSSFAPFAVLLPALAFLIVQLAGRGALGLPLDDAWIHAAYAQSIVDGEPFRLGVQGETAPGSSAPLWTLLLTPLHAAAAVFGVGPHARAVLSALVLGLLCAIAAAFALRRLLSELRVGEPWRALFLIVFAFTPRWVWGTLSGLEVSLYTALVLAALAAHAAAKNAGRASALALPLCALAGWSRPECFVLPLLLALDAWWFPSRVPNARRACSLRGIAIALALIALYAGGHYALYGRPLPTTFYVKAEVNTAIAALLRGELSDALLIALESAGRQALAALAFFPAQILPLVPWILLGARTAFSQSSRAGTALVLVLACFPLLQGAVKFHYPENQVGRYLWHQLAPYLALAALGLQHALRLERARSQNAIFWLGTAAVLGSAFPVVVGLASDAPSGALFATLRYLLWNDIDRELLTASLGFYTHTSAAIAIALFAVSAAGLHAARSLSSRLLRVAAASTLALGVLWAALSCIPIARLAARNVDETERVSVASARWLAEHASSQDLVALHDLGAIAYFAHCRLLDLQGIGSPRVLEVPRGADGRRDLAPLLLAERPRFYAGFLEWHLPDLIGTASAWSELPAAGESPEAFAERRTRASFELAETVTLGGTRFVIFELPW